MSAPIEEQLDLLKKRLLEINDLRSAGAVLGWDQATYMPVGGSVSRSRQRATLSRYAHQQATDAELGRLLDTLHSDSNDLSEPESSLVRIARRDFEKASKVPARFVERASAHQSQSYAAWTAAREENDFAAMIPFLTTSVELSQEYAEFFAPFAHVCDPLIDDADEGMTVAAIRQLFAELRPALINLTREICDRPQRAVSCLKGAFNEDQQLALALSMVEAIGYDLSRGRLDQTAHPFSTRFSRGDVRITTRVRKDDIQEALFSTLHEAGHALYEQGVSGHFDGTPLGRGASAGLHESQARLWENTVGRSYPFWEHWYPILKDKFPGSYANVSLDDFYAAINRVEPSLIRTDADEVTYNLHIMLRFDLELEMLEGRLTVKDLPEAWRARMREYLGVEPETDAEGCLQDVHWYAGQIGGAFQGYTIGNILAAQFFEAALLAQPDIPQQIARGDCSRLLDWLRAEVHQHGRRYQPNELIARATGKPLCITPYLKYLRGKFEALYSLTAGQLGRTAKGPLNFSSSKR
jgi:carboxypeptidase Taq